MYYDSMTAASIPGVAQVAQAESPGRREVPAAASGTGRRPGGRRRYAAARVAAVVGTGIAATGFWVAVVSAPLPASAGALGAQGQGGRMMGMAGMQHGPGGASGVRGGGMAGMDHGAMGSGAMRHGPTGGAMGPRLRTRGS